jgi:flagellar motility protein MotE (MotC chaperone)
VIRKGSKVRRSGSDAGVLMRGPSVRPAGREGAGAVGSFLLLVVGGGLAMVVIGLFLTGLAQEHIIPYFKERAEGAMNQAKEKAEETVAGLQKAEQDSLPEVQAPEADSLAAFLTQAETQKKFLEERKRELEGIRSEIDALLTQSESAQDEELMRQSKLLAGMRPAEAAKVLAMMDDGSVRGILGAMNSRAAAKVVAQMDARRVARLSMTALRRAEVSNLERP